jgi:dethiobiotin synthetase
VTGTDTAVGKTVVAAALIGLLRRRRLSVAAMKPVETGVLNGRPLDALRLAQAAGATDPLEDVCPCTFAEPVAPLVAAERSGRALDPATLDAAFARLCAVRDAVVVEGAGGLLVPLTRLISYADLFARWRLALIIVAANRLGALNHTLLTVHAARSAGLPIRGIVLNAPGAEPNLATLTNPCALEELMPDVPVFAFPRVPCVSDDQALADQAEQSGLAALIDGHRGSGA